MNPRNNAMLLLRWPPAARCPRFHRPRGGRRIADRSALVQIGPPTRRRL